MLLIDLPAEGEPGIEIRCVTYDQEGWARTMEGAGIAAVFVEPVRTGVWTTGVASLPPSERFRLAARRIGSGEPAPEPPRIGGLSFWTLGPGGGH